MRPSSLTSSPRPGRHSICWLRWWTVPRVVAGGAAGDGEGNRGDFMFCKLLLTGIFVATLVLAQGRGGGGGGDMGEGGGGGRGGLDVPSMGPSRPSRLDQLTQTLKLNKDQKKDVKSILDEAQKDATPVREQMAKSRMAIGDAIQAGKSQDEVNQLVSSEAALESQMA